MRYLEALATTDGAFRPALAAVNRWLAHTEQAPITRAELALTLRPSTPETAEDADLVLALCSTATRAAVLLARAQQRPLSAVLQTPRAGALKLALDPETREALLEHLSFSPDGPWLFPGTRGPLNEATLRRELAAHRTGPRVTIRAVVRQNASGAARLDGPGARSRDGG